MKCLHVFIGYSQVLFKSLDLFRLNNTTQHMVLCTCFSIDFDCT